MHTNTLLLTTFSTLLALSSATPLKLRSPAGGPQSPPTCGVCNPISGLNKCDVSTSCINIGSSFHCACRAGFKATTDPANTWDQFRIDNLPNYESLVFVPENMPCNTPCADPTAAPSELCQEVKAQECGGTPSSNKREVEEREAEADLQKRGSGSVGNVQGCGKKQKREPWMVCNDPPEGSDDTTTTTATSTEVAAPTQSP